VLTKWHKKVGDKIKSGDVLAEVETDKATMDFESFQEGTLLYIGAKEGEAIPVDSVIAVLGNEGEDYKSLLEEKPAVKQEDVKQEEKKETEKEDTKEAPKDVKKDAATEQPSTQTSQSSADSRIKASPLAKRLAEEKGIDLSSVKGSAENGRIIKKDVENFKTATPPSSKSSAQKIVIPQYTGEEKYKEVAVSQMRKTIAKRLSESMFTAPHFYLTVTVDMDKAMEARTKINELAPLKISFNDIVLKAVAVSLKQHPNVNSSWLGDKIRYNEHINIGVAVAVEDGLLVPVVRYADGKSLSHISAEVKEFAQKAKDKKLQPSDWEGSTFTISNLGMFGIDEFTAIINPPDACILAIGGIQQVPVVKEAQVVPGNIMKLTLSCDHRVVDGATGASFLQTLKAMLEEPVRLLM
jgi:pyruvate dehydrogenase E2 component (dihydrolipoamide acetyltransferase)